MRVPFLDLHAPYVELAAELESAASRVMRSGHYILGPELEAFESEFADYCGTRHAVGVGNGLDALALTLEAWGVGPGDEVIVPASTFIATWLAVSRVGATVQPVEPDPTTGLIDPLQVEASITRRTAAILPVHLYGTPADMVEINRVANRYRLPVLEDACQAHGASIDGRRTGNLGTAAAFSMYPGKNLGAFGDAGIITTNDADLAQKVRALRNYGSTQKYVHDMRGTNSRLDELQAALLRVKLAHLDEWNDRRKERAGLYRSHLGDLPWCELFSPGNNYQADPVWHLFPVLVADRDNVRGRLSAHGIDCLLHYPTPPHLSKAFADYGWMAGAFPIAERIARQELSLPMGPHLTLEEVEWVCRSLMSVYADLGLDSGGQ